MPYKDNRKNISKALRWNKQNRHRHNKISRDSKYQIRRDRKELLYLLKDQPCTDCGKKFPHYIMEWDHCRGRKAFNITQGITKGYMTIEREIAKCDLVCANCHRARTWARRSQNGKH